jgi:hypothetical protein
VAARGPDDGHPGRLHERGVRATLHGRRTVRVLTVRIAVVVEPPRGFVEALLWPWLCGAA